MVSKCNACGKYLSPSSPEGVTCPKCKKCSHRACIGVSKEFQVHKNWACTECIAKLPKGNNQNTPLKPPEMAGGVCELESDELNKYVIKPTPEILDSPSRDSWKAEIFDQMQRICDEIKDSFKEKIDKVRDEIKAFKQDVLKVKKTVEACEVRLSSLEERMDVQENKADEHPEGNKTIQALQSTLAQLKLDINDRDQELLSNDLDLTGIAESGGENTTHVVITCLSKLGVSLAEHDLVSCARVGGVPASKEGAPPRPRHIAVRLARRAMRDEILKAARVRRSATTEGVGVPGEPRPFYVNERLTRQNRSLFNRTRRARKLADWKYAWTREGKVYVRRNYGAPLHRVRSEADLERVFGIDLVRDMDAEISN